MKRPPLTLFLLFFLGCATTHQFGEGPGRIDVAEARGELWQKEGRLILMNGERIDGKVVYLDQKELFFLPDDAEDRLSFSTREVSAVTVQGDRVPGMFAGIVAGGVIGGVAGSSVENERSGWIDLVNEHDVSIVGGAILGAVVGGVVGYWILPSRTTVTFSSPNSSVVTSLAQPGVGRSVEVVAVLVPALFEENERFVAFIISGKTICLQRSQITLEYQSNGVLIRASRRTFQNAGLELD